MPRVRTTVRRCRKAFAHAPLRHAIESLEARLLLSTYTVTSTADNGPGTLRDAVQQVNAIADRGTIVFDPGVPLATITLTSGPLEIGNSPAKVTIVGGVTLSGNNRTNLFQIDSGAAVELRGLRMTGGKSVNGGAILNNGKLVIDDCTLDDNTASGVGGAIYNGKAGTLLLTNDTIFQNAAGPDGGGLYNDHGVATLNNTIVVRDTILGRTVAKDIAGTSVSGSYNWVWDGSGGLNPSDHNLSGDITIDSNLAAPDYNGGACQTVALLPGCIAIDAGSNALAVDGNGNRLTTDQRGFPRISNGAVDIGAYEVQSSVTVNTASDQTQSGDALTSLRQAIAIADADTGPDQVTVHFDPMVFAAGSLHTIVLSQGPLDIANSFNGHGGSLTLQGPGPGVLAVSASGRSRVMRIVNYGGAVEINGMAITDGSAPKDSGGGILDEGNLAITNCAFLHNSADAGGAIYAFGRVAVSGSLFSANSASFDGGAILGSATISNCTFSANSAGLHGGALDVGRTTISDTTFVGNTAGYDGGAIYLSGPSSFPGVPVSIVGSSFTGNLARNGGGIFNGGALTVTASTFSGNRALDPAGGSTSSNHLGGAIYNGAEDGSGSDLTVLDSTFFGNSADYGGGIDDGQSSTLSSINNTLAGNAAANGGGMYVALLSSASIKNSIVAKNTLSDGTTPSDISGGTVTGWNNLIGTGGSGELVNGMNGNIVAVADPKLGPLADNGGLTQTMGLLTGSPAIDAGSNALALGPDGKPFLTDQRGYARIVNGIVDIGAYESGSSIPGDANADGVVDFKDLVILASHYGQQSGATFAQGDFNGDGKVDFSDLVLLAQYYGKRR